tara:strand:+ start:109 stop:2058 length:1950 start_codon:yes stop_codon:yes gene_type:complete
MNTKVDRKIAVILVADVVGYSKHMERDENATLKAYAECEKILKTCLKKYEGSIFNTAGDSALAEFQSAVNAVECGVAFQNDIKKRNETDKTEVKLEFRIGINMGDVVKKEGNLFGDGVNIAARLEALAQPNGISISKSVYDLVVPKTKMTFNDLGVQKVKQNEFHAFDILLDPSQKRKLKTKSRSMIPIIGGIAAVFVVGIITLFFVFQDQENAQFDQNNILLVRSFENVSNDPSQDFVADSMLNVFVTGLSGYSDLKVLSKNTVKEIEKNKLNDDEVQKKYGANFVLNGSITVFGEKMRTNLQIVNLEDDSVLLSEIKDTEITELFELQDTLVLGVLESFKLEEDKIRVSNDDIKTIEELRLLQFAAKEREKWSRASYPSYEDAINKLYAINPDGYAHNLGKAWQYHYKHRLGFCANKEMTKEVRKKNTTMCFEKALEHANKAIKANSAKADAYLAKGYFLSGLYLANKGGSREQEWGGREKAVEVADKGYSLISNDSYQFGLAGEVYGLSSEFEKSTIAFKKLFELDDRPTDTFTSFYMQMSYLNNDYEVAGNLAEKIIRDSSSKADTSNCKNPFCGNAGYAYLFLIYATNHKGDDVMLKKYLAEYKSLDNKYTRDMWLSRLNPMRGLWPKQAVGITDLMDELGWAS